jgi:hypothetical protein
MVHGVLQRLVQSDIHDRSTRECEGSTRLTILVMPAPAGMTQ